MRKIDLSFKIGGFTIEFLLTKKLSKKVDRLIGLAKTLVDTDSK